MRQLKKAITGILMFFGMLLTTGGLPGNVYAATSYSVISNETAHTYDISREQYSAILSALREAAAAGYTHGNKHWVDTGVVCGDYAEGSTVCYAFKHLYMGERDFFVCWNDPYILMGDFSMQYPGMPKGHIFVTWKDTADAASSLAHQDCSMAVAEQIISEAPQDLTQKLKYYNDRLAEIISYDYEGYYRGEGKQEPFHGLLEGSCVCSGYADTFFNLCWLSGIDCASTSCITADSKDGEADHRFNAVRFSGVWKRIDVTWNDQETWISYDYFLRSLDETWQNSLNEPHALMELIQ